MKYESKTFTIPMPTTDAFADGWERTFGKKRANVTVDHGSTACDTAAVSVEDNTATTDTPENVP